MNLTKERVSGYSEALEYMTECTLATVVDMAISSRPKIGEFRRQINIAQNGIAWLVEYGRPERNTCQRVSDIVNNYQGNVMRWAMDKRHQWHPDKPVKFKN